MTSARTLGNKPIEFDALRLQTLLSVAARTGSLVGGNEIVTLDGRMLVTHSTRLTAEVTAAATSISVEASDLAINDVLLLAARGNVEWLLVTGAASGSGPYTYTVTRNLDGSGADAWQTGDVVANTGQAGDGMVELYSATSGLIGTNLGPAVSLWARNSSTYNDIGQRVRIGNLDGARGYSGTTWGAWFGKYVSGYPWLAIDDANGVRIMDYTTQRFRVDTSGNVTIGNPSDWNTYIYPGGLELRSGTTAHLAAAGASLRLGTTGAGNTIISIAGGAIYAYKVLTADPLTTQTLFSISGTEIALDTGDFVIASTGALRIHTTAALTGDGVWASYNAGVPVFRVGTIAAGALDRGIYWNGADIQIKSDRMTLDDIGGVYTIAGWTFDLYTFYSFTGKTMLDSLHGRIELNLQAGIDGDDATWRIWAGSAWSGRATAPFRVRYDGAMWATGATISGNMTVTGGTITGSLSILTSGVLHSGASGILNDDGYWFEYNGGTPRARVGTVSGGVLTKGVYWDGSELLVKNGNGLILDNDGLQLPIGDSGTALVLWLDGSTPRAEIWGNYATSLASLNLVATYGSGVNPLSIQLALMADYGAGEQYASLYQPNISGTFKGMQIGAGPFASAPTSMLDVVGDVEVGSANAYYMGDPTTNDSWRMVRSGNDLVMQRRESGSWVTKQTIAA